MAQTGRLRISADELATMVVTAEQLKPYPAQLRNLRTKHLAENKVQIKYKNKQKMAAEM